MIRDLICRFSRYEWAKGKKLIIDQPFFDVEIETDPTLLGRIMVNMIKNALEASNQGDTVRMGARPEQEGIQLYVNNLRSFPEPSNFKSSNGPLPPRGQVEAWGPTA